MPLLVDHLDMEVDPLSTSPPSFVCPQDMTRTDDRQTSSDSASVKSESNSDSPESSSQPTKKKRKSWGQVLPEPTTTLPPRKRAKTEEEKAQRKYERVQRNRQAAHMSRMRKQEEMDQLHSQNNKLKQESQEKDEIIARLSQEIADLTRQRKLTNPSRPRSPFSETDAVPSLDSASPAASADSDAVHTPPQSPQRLCLPSQMKQSDDSHSAEMCSQQWTSDLRNSATDMMMMMPPAFAPPPTGQMDLQYEDFFNIGDIDCPITSDLSFDFNDKSFFDFCSPEIQDTKLS